MRLEPASPEAWRRLGEYYAVNLDDPARAVPVLQGALFLDPASQLNRSAYLVALRARTTAEMERVAAERAARARRAARRAQARPPRPTSSRRTLSGAVDFVAPRSSYGRPFRQGGSDEVHAADPSGHHPDAGVGGVGAAFRRTSRRRSTPRTRRINETPGVTPALQTAAPGDGDHRAGAGRQDADHRRPVRRDQGGDRRLPACSRPTTSTPRSSWPRGSRRPAWAARSRCARSWSGSDPRAGLPRPVGTRPRCADRLPRRLRPRRGSRAGGLRDRRGALAARRSPGQPGRLAGDDGAQPRDRSHPPRSHAGREDPPARGARGGGGQRGRDDVSRRATRARLHLLSSGARHRRAGRAHAADARRPDHRRDRARLPGPRADDGAAAGAGEAQDQGRRDPVPGAARPPAARSARRRARGRLPDLQRGLRWPRRAGGRGDSGSGGRSPS